MQGLFEWFVSLVIVAVGVVLIVGFIYLCDHYPGKVLIGCLVFGFLTFTWAVREVIFHGG